MFMQYFPTINFHAVMWLINTSYSNTGPKVQKLPSIGAANF